MITWVRTATVHDGKMQEAFAWALKASRYVNERFSEVNIQVVRNITGPVYEIHWVANYDSLATFDRLTRQVQADAGYQELLAESRQPPLFIGSSIVDHLYEAVS